MAKWECHGCGRTIDLEADDNCPTCGQPLPDPGEIVDESLEGFPCRAGFAPDIPRPIDECPKCRGKMYHCRLKGYRCPNCELSEPPTPNLEG